MDLKKLRVFTPVGNRVVMKAHKARKQHAGLLLPDETIVFTPVCTVVAVGPDCKQVKPGDVVGIDPGTVLNMIHLPYSESDKHLFCCCAEDKVLVVLDPDAFAAQASEDDLMNAPAIKRGKVLAPPTGMSFDNAR